MKTTYKIFKVEYRGAAQPGGLGLYDTVEVDGNRNDAMRKFISDKQIDTAETFFILNTDENVLFQFKVTPPPKPECKIEQIDF